MRVTCSKYPNLLVRDVGVRFVDGAADVIDSRKIEALRAMQGFGFAFEGPEPEEDELAALQAQADALGIQYHPSIGAQKLRERVEQAMGTANPV